MSEHLVYTFCTHMYNNRCVAHFKHWQKPQRDKCVQLYKEISFTDDGKILIRVCGENHQTVVNKPQTTGANQTY